jgi:glycosyltransferase involved in cell wall biosynthesis
LPFLNYGIGVYSKGIDVVSLIGNSTGPLVSVIIPTRNRCFLLARAIESVLKQNYSDIELVIVDDASGDSTKETVDKYRQRFRNIKYIRNNVRCRSAKSRNIGLANVSGKYIAFLDDDDEWLPDKILKQVKVLEENLDVGAVSCWYNRLYNGKIQKVKLVPTVTFESMLWANFLGSFSFCMVRGDVARSVRLDPGLYSSQDWCFWIELSKVTRIHIIKEYLVNYYDHPEARISSQPLNTLLVNRRKVYLKFRNYMSEKCRMYHILSFRQHRILASNNSSLKKCYMLIGMGFKSKIARFRLKNSVMSFILKRLNLNSQRYLWSTYRFIKSIESDHL